MAGGYQSFFPVLHYPVIYANQAFMKQYVVDELRPGEADKITGYLNKAFGPPEFSSLFWIPVPEAILSPVQAGHKSCQPFYFVVDVNESQLSCELLVRTRSVIRCNCIGYADRRQRDWLLSYIDSVFEQLEIIT
jgi:hypothetical protein